LEGASDRATHWQLGKICDYKGTLAIVVFLIFISYGVAGVFPAMLVGLIYVPGWSPYAFTMAWIVWYFWDIEMTCVLILQRNYSLIGKLEGEQQQLGLKESRRYI
jgi:hypothetical protein